MPNKNYYEVLELASDASPEAIKEQYRFLLHAWHPDKFPNPQLKLRAQERTKEINEAYETLGDRQKRIQYDVLLRNRTTSDVASKQHPTSNPHSQQPTDFEQRRAEYVRQRQQEAEAERQRVEKERQQYVREQAERLQAEQKHSQYATSNPTQGPLDFPVACQRCGRSDASLRWSVFPYVVSVIILTFRRAWGDLFCGRCRRREMFRAKLLTFIFGWWGLPWGFFYTLGVLFKSDDGEVPTDVNADYLKALGIYFLQSGQIGEALLTFNSSLQLKHDLQLEQMVKELFGKTSASPVSAAHDRGLGFTPVFLGTIVVAFLIIFLLPIFSGTLPPSAPSVNNPTAKSVTVTPNAPPTPTSIPTVPTSTPQPLQGWKRYKSDRAYFSAYIPDKWIGSYFPPSADNPLRGVAFAPSATLRGDDATTISVMSVPMVDVADAQVMSTADLKQSANKWLIDRKLKAIRLPAEMEIGGHTAVWMVHEAELQDKAYKLRAYAAMISTPKWFYYIEVAGLAEHDDVVHEYFDEFIRHFQPDVE